MKECIRAVAAAVFCFLRFVNLELSTEFCSDIFVGWDIQYEPKCGNCRIKVYHLNVETSLWIGNTAGQMANIENVLFDLKGYMLPKHISM